MTEATAEPITEEATEAKNTITTDCVTARADSRQGVRVNRAEETTEERTQARTATRLRKENEENDFPPEKKGSWTMKEQRQGEADNPGPGNEEVVSDGDAMPALIQEEDSELEAAPDETDAKESDDDTGWRSRKAERDNVKAEAKTTGENDSGGGKPKLPAQALRMPTTHRGAEEGEDREMKPLVNSGSSLTIAQPWPPKELKSKDGRRMSLHCKRHV